MSNACVAVRGGVRFCFRRAGHGGEAEAAGAAMPDHLMRANDLYRRSHLMRG